MAELRLNFANVSVLIVDGDYYSRILVKQMMRGFGVQEQHQAAKAEEAKDILTKTAIDLCLVEADLPDMLGTELVRWMRRRQEETLRFMPVLLLTGYTQIKNIAACRDCGANGMIKKPFSPKTLFEHVAWAAASKKPYVESGKYIGPDRRFHTDPAYDGPMRRATDEQPQTTDEAAPDQPATENAA